MCDWNIGGEELFEVIMDRNFLKLITDIKLREHQAG